MDGIHSTGSKTFTLDTIPRKSTLSVGNGTLDTPLALTVTRKSTNFSHTIVAKCGSASTTICSKSKSDSITFTPPLSWASQNTTGTSLSVTYTITTYNGDTSVGSNSYSKTCSIPAKVAPSCKITVEDANGYLSTYGAYIKGKSRFKVVVTPTTSYGSAIASYSTTANGSTYTSASFTTGTLKSHGTLTIKATVKDKRGRSGTASVSLTVWNYAAPSITKLDVRRCNSDGTANDQGEYVQVTFSGKATSLENKNTVTYTLYHKKTSDGSFTTVSLPDYTGQYSVSNATYIFPAETGSSYDVRFAVKDAFSTVTSNTSASTAFTIMHFSAGGTGIGIGKVSESENLLDIGIPVIFREGVVTKLLWSGGHYMATDQIARLAEPVSKQMTGIVLVFSRYADGESKNEQFSSCFIPKYLVSAHPGCGHDFKLGGIWNAGAKYLYIYDEQIVGHEKNSQTVTVGGITYANDDFVMRYVIGV